jgi:uncharacterized lipoprotein
MRARLLKLQSKFTRGWAKYPKRTERADFALRRRTKERHALSARPRTNLEAPESNWLVMGTSAVVNSTN